MLLWKRQGALYILPGRPAEDSNKRDLQKAEGKERNNNRDMCLEKRQVKARNEKTETDKIDERRIKSAD